MFILADQVPCYCAHCGTAMRLDGQKFAHCLASVPLSCSQCGSVFQVVPHERLTCSSSQRDHVAAR